MADQALVAASGTPTSPLADGVTMGMLQFHRLCPYLRAHVVANPGFGGGVC